LIVQLQPGEGSIDLELPAETDCLSAPVEKNLDHVESRVAAMLRTDSDNGECLAAIVRRAVERRERPRVTIVLSDLTRPVPYRRPEGILWPIIEVLGEEGIPRDGISLLIASGTHAPLSPGEMERLVGRDIFSSVGGVLCHDYRDPVGLVHLGKTKQGTEAWVNRRYLKSDIRILTGLVESHFMAGFSGGRKSICPGLAGEETIWSFHGAHILSQPGADNLRLADNPCHREALEIATMAGADYALNVTVDRRHRVTGLFGGELKKAHEAAVAHARRSTEIKCGHRYDVVITHGGYVARNHYQAAKAAVAAVPLLHPNSSLVLLADTADAEPVGSDSYRLLLAEMKRRGANGFLRTITDSHWKPRLDQWQVQMWAKVLARIPERNLHYFSPQTPATDYAILPGAGCPVCSRPDSALRHDEHEEIGVVTARVVAEVIGSQATAFGHPPRVAVLLDGPYGIPLLVPDIRTEAKTDD
jgi:lactate racemase